MSLTVYVPAMDVARGLRDDAAFTAEVLNEMAYGGDCGDRWITEFLDEADDAAKGLIEVLAAAIVAEWEAQ